MAYCTATEVRDVLSGVTIAKMDDTAVENKISYAESMINAYLSSRYTVPFVSTPPLVKTICIDMSAYYVLRTLFTRDSVNKNKYIDEFLLKHLDTSEKTGTIYDILNGLLPIIDDEGNEIPASSDLIDSNTKDYVPIFDVDSDLDWRVDPDRLEDIANDRDS
jgi:phage gp36-like protein